MRTRSFGPYSAATHRIFIPVVYAQLELSAYEMDVELLFSAQPFGSGSVRASAAGSAGGRDTSRFSFVKPRATARLATADADETLVRLSELFPALGCVAGAGGLNGICARGITEMNRIHLVLFNMNHGIFEPGLAAIHWGLISV
jgi:hypothetical protein